MTQVVGHRASGFIYPPVSFVSSIEKGLAFFPENVYSRQ